MTNGQAPEFEGYRRPHGTYIPDEILDDMGGRPYTETLVLIYIARRTFGFQKSQDAISYSQFTDGIKARDGRVVDTGCGVKSRKTLAAAIKSLEVQGRIVVERSERNGEPQTTVYRLRLNEEEVVPRGNPDDETEQVTIRKSVLYQRLVEAYGEICMRCRIEGVNLQIDHVVARSRGGSNNFDNRQLLCGPCNKQKWVREADYRPVVMP